MATYYAGAIMIQSVGLEPEKATLVLGFLGVSGWFFVIAGCFYFVSHLVPPAPVPFHPIQNLTDWTHLQMERVGRVNTMIIGAAGCCVGQILLASGVAHQDVRGGGIVAAAGLFLFLSIFEVSPLAIRTRIATLGIACQYLLNFVVVMVTPTAISSIGWGYYAIFAGVNGLMCPIIWYYCPEVAGLTLEGVDELFAGGKVHMRRTVRVDGSGRLHADILEANKPEGSFEHVEKIESEK
ncbi:hypothetical protein Rhopal_007299-T1 [Rhodotorula paludigena]|uniref:Uncharacterized protein n=1 Tax=Rhodotorula paludigena TaxID=86838 RepID=A0AAV5GWA0_9BASI|nr:hypothetical protein Rhopal_007299-T1 [Rhodotorula paludigena]